MWPSVSPCLTRYTSGCPAFNLAALTAAAADACNEAAAAASDAAAAEAAEAAMVAADAPDAPEAPDTAAAAGPAEPPTPACAPCCATFAQPLIATATQTPATLAIMVLSKRLLNKCDSCLVRRRAQVFRVAGNARIPRKRCDFAIRATASCGHHSCPASTWCLRAKHLDNEAFHGKGRQVGD
jgi:hypothetical protein